LGNFIPVATPDTNAVPGIDTYKIVMKEFQQLLHPDLPGPTTFWGYADATNSDSKYLGGLIVAHKDRPVRLEVTNALPNVHPLPVDTTIMGAEMQANRATVHLHGGLVPWTSDGGPYSWFTPSATGPNQGAGSCFLNPGPNPGQAIYYYPNAQSARLLWYHDHALGTTRLNAYAGLAAGYLIRDDFEDVLINTGILPTREIPLIIQDKSFNDGTDPAYSWGRAGGLWYPYVYDTAKYGPLGTASSKLPPESIVPEFCGDTILVNGAPSPYLNVEPRLYRFRILNGSQARFFNLQLYYADSSGTAADLANPGPPWVQFGTEAGFLPAPVLLNAPPVPTPMLAPDMANAAGPFNLLLAPAERADVIIDFSNVPTGARLILYNDAPSPFPGGDPTNDHHQPFATGNTRSLLQFRVVPAVSPRDPFDLPGTFQALQSVLANLAGELLDPASANLTRDVTLNEDFDDYGRLRQRLGTTTQNGLDSEGNSNWGRDYTDPPTEIAQNGSVEIWRIFNLTEDCHPMHFHLSNVQILGRAPFDAVTPDFKQIGPAIPPDPNELGWKETVRANPGEVTTVIMKMQLPAVPFNVPPSPRLQAYGINGAEYVWHCHILEHEEHDMMRPLVVV
jgi:spore coat protein A